jgi:Recombination endonuclease VII
MTATGKWKYPKAKPTPGKVCKDCKTEPHRGLARPAPYPGPRCATHHREKLRAARLARSVKHVERTYDLTDEEYQALYEFQGGLCALCRRAKGTGKRRLAVDHDHRRGCGHDPAKGCKQCTRGLLCATCNDVLAHFRDAPLAGARMIEYLALPPWGRLRDGASSWPPR